jgi:hypothetical protein
MATMTNEQANAEQVAYETRMVDFCSIMQLFALLVDTDEESRALTRGERIALANEYALDWAKSRGFSISEKA